MLYSMEDQPHDRKTSDRTTHTLYFFLCCPSSIQLETLDNPAISWDALSLNNLTATMCQLLRYYFQFFQLVISVYIVGKANLGNTLCPMSDNSSECNHVWFPELLSWCHIDQRLHLIISWPQDVEYRPFPKINLNPNQYILGCFVRPVSVSTSSDWSWRLEVDFFYHLPTPSPISCSFWRMTSVGRRAEAFTLSQFDHLFPIG